MQEDHFLNISLTARKLDLYVVRRSIHAAIDWILPDCPCSASSRMTGAIFTASGLVPTMERTFTGGLEVPGRCSSHARQTRYPEGIDSPC